MTVDFDLDEKDADRVVAPIAQNIVVGTVAVVGLKLNTVRWRFDDGQQATGVSCGVVREDVAKRANQPHPCQLLC